jgi:hypothetical protein
MLKISICESRRRLRLVLEGKLVNPWTGTLRDACAEARSELRDRELVIDVKNITAISQEGEELLLELMREGVTFRSSGVFTKHLVGQLARRARRNE